MIKCGKCGNPGKAWHICVDLSYRAPGEGKINSPNKTQYKMTEDHKDKLREASKKRWAKNRGISSLG